ncbi:permease [Salmonella enterica subsp. enterica]|uniref:Permease n=1 Tax=Salmonella enterica I TaxID=59201 RepID=A0A3S4IXD9_SALET|nr:permease [Salmonella enterica subsp. enterica]
MGYLNGYLFSWQGWNAIGGIMSDDAGDRIIYLPVYFRKI